MDSRYYIDSAPWKSTSLFMQVRQASCSKSIKDIIKHMGVGPWVQPIKLSFPFTLKHHAVLLSVYAPSKKRLLIQEVRVTSNQMLFWLSDIFLRIEAGQPPRVVKNLVPTSSSATNWRHLQIRKLVFFLSKALSMYVSRGYFFFSKPFHHKIRKIDVTHKYLENIILVRRY